MNPWAEFAKFLAALYHLLRQEWGCSVPGYNQLPSDSVEAECDFWCGRLADNPNAPILPPAGVRPWLLARIASAASAARMRGEFPDSGGSMAQVTPKFVRERLIDDWHRELKARWPLMAGESDSLTE